MACHVSARHVGDELARGDTRSKEVLGGCVPPRKRCLGPALRILSIFMHASAVSSRRSGGWNSWGTQVYCFLFFRCLPRWQRHAWLPAAFVTVQSPVRGTGRIQREKEPVPPSSESSQSMCGYLETTGYHHSKGPERASQTPHFTNGVMEAWRK